MCPQADVERVSGFGKAQARETPWALLHIENSFIAGRIREELVKTQIMNFALSSANRYPKVRFVTYTLYGTAEAKQPQHLL